MLGLARPDLLHLVSEELLLERINLLLHVQALQVLLHHSALLLVVALLDHAFLVGLESTLLHVDAFHLVNTCLALSQVCGSARGSFDVPDELGVVLLLPLAGRLLHAAVPVNLLLPNFAVLLLLGFLLFAGLRETLPVLIHGLLHGLTALVAFVHQSHVLLIVHLILHLLLHPHHVCVSDDFVGHLGEVARASLQML